jgi:hypothetical protein
LEILELYYFRKIKLLKLHRITNQLNYHRKIEFNQTVEKYIEQNILYLQTQALKLKCMKMDLLEFFQVGFLSLEH